MNRTIAVILFIASLLFFTLSPTGEVLTDAVTPPQRAAQAQNASGASTLMGKPDYTPVPTFAPTPAPQPTATPKAVATPKPTPTPVPTPAPTPMAAGARGEDVMKLQKTLIALGFLPDEADGIYGEATVVAINNLKTFLNEQHAKAQVTQPAGQFVEDEDAQEAADAYEINGQAEDRLLSELYSSSFGDVYEPLADGSTGSAVKRIQSRLVTLGYAYKGVDGAYGKTTTEAVKYFQKVNNLPQTGIADRNTQALLFSQTAVASDRPLHEYKVVVDLSDQRVYVYQWSNDDVDYKKLVRKMKCSSGASGTPTPRGTFTDTVRRGEIWHHFKDFGNCWAQYAIHIDDTGNIMFHSVLFTRRGGKPTSSSVHALGRRASHGCVRLAVKDAKWLYEHITDGTTVVIKK